MSTKASRPGALLAAVAAMAPGAGWALPAPAGVDQATGDQAPAAATPDTTGADQADLYALDYDVDVAEARERMARQGPLIEALGRLRQLAGDRLAGAWIEHRPDLRGVVRLTGPVADPAAVDAVVAGSPAPIEVRTDAARSLAQLETERAKVEEALGRALPGATTGIDEPTGSVVVYAPAATPGQRQSSEAARPELRAVTDAPVRVTSQRGDLELMANYGGDRITACTSGFSVVHTPTGQQGIVTAGHCPTSLQYQGYNGERFPLTRVAGEVSGVTDAAVYTSSHISLPQFYASSTSVLRNLDDVLPWDYQVEGTFVCHQGRTTGYSCGTITDRASTECDSSTDCQPYWVRVEGDVLACASGDSGGPWFAGTVGYGILHGGNNTGTGAGQCTYAIYTPLDFKFTRLNAVAVTTGS